MGADFEGLGSWDNVQVSHDTGPFPFVVSRVEALVRLPGPLRRRGFSLSRVAIERRVQPDEGEALRTLPGCGERPPASVQWQVSPVPLGLRRPPAGSPGG